jgi:hypothetical protein
MTLRISVDHASLRLNRKTLLFRRHLHGGDLAQIEPDSIRFADGVNGARLHGPFAHTHFIVFPS